jgi:transcriptional regulator NrdR family protein
MVCVYCSNETKVTNSRTQKRLNRTWRRRQCLNCKATVSTIEQLDPSTALKVTNRSGALKPFLRDKLFLSVHFSLQHRKTALTDATALTDTIIANVLAQTSDPTISSQTLAEQCFVVLNRFDKVAATHYKAYHDY